MEQKNIYIKPLEDNKKMDKLEKLTIMLINSSIGTSTVRNQGNGIAEPIRKKLEKVFHFEEFFTKLKSNNLEDFEEYLNYLTNKLNGINGQARNTNPPGRVKWGTARKCVNLLLRSTVYNGFIWDKHELNENDFNQGGLMDKLELPLDSYVAKGIKEDCHEYSIIFDKKTYASFRIININKKANDYYQSKALEIGKARELCRIDLDLYYWRSEKKLKTK